MEGGSENQEQTTSSRGTSLVNIFLGNVHRCQEITAAMESIFEEQGREDGWIRARKRLAQLIGVLSTMEEELASAPELVMCYPSNSNGMDRLLVDVHPSSCKLIGCSLFASHDFPGVVAGIGALCQKHKLPGMVKFFPEGRVLSMKTKDKKRREKNTDYGPCYYRGCNIYAKYICPKGKCCWQHKAVSNPNSEGVCKFPRCCIVGTFSYPDKSGKYVQERGYCIEHRAPDMISKPQKLRKPCELSDCARPALFNDKDSPGARFCDNHKQPGMVKRGHSVSCSHPGCSRDGHNAYLVNSITGKKDWFCITHGRKVNAVQKLKRCEAPGCTLFPSFGNIGTAGKGRKRRFCSAHKLPGWYPAGSLGSTCALNISLFPDLSQKPSAIAGMTDFNKKRFCKHEGCTKQAAYNYENSTGKLFCTVHKLEGMVNMPYMYRLRKLQRQKDS